MIVEHYSVDDGLPNNVVNCSLKDKDGFLWFGTWYGLCRFDGVKFRTYNKLEDEESALPPRKIQRIVEDKNGYIWVKTIDRKLYVFNKEKETFHAVFDDMKNYSENIQVIKLQSTFDGDILLLTRDKNLLLAQTNEVGSVSIKLIFDSKDEVSPSTYRMKNNVLSETREYISWVGVDYKVLAFKKGESLAERPANYILNKMNVTSDANFTSVYADGKKMWVGENTGIFYSIDTQTGSVDKFVLSELRGSITSLMVTPTGYVYLALANNGIYEYDLKERVLQKINIDIDDRLVANIYMDKYDKMWFHENEKAIVYYDPQNRITKRYPFSITGKIGLFHVEDVGERGLFFLSSTGEAWMFDRENLKMIKINEIKQIANAETEQRFFHLFQDGDGGIWFSSATQGVYQLNFPRKQFRLFVPPLQNVSQLNEDLGIRALYQAENGDLWVGTRSKYIYKLDKDANVKQVFTPDTHNTGAIYHIMEDRKGNMWFATKGNGLIRATPDPKAKDGYRFEHFKHNMNNPTTISGNDVYYAFQDSRERIWVGLLDGGLNLLVEENGKVSFQNINNGFKNYPGYGLYMEVRNILEDEKGRIWVGTMDGLMSFDSNFDTVDQIKFETYRQKNRRSFIDSDVYTLFKDSYSQIWVSMFGGGLSKLVGYNVETHMPEFKSFGLREGLNNDVIMSMVEDNNDHIWFATENGLSHYDLNNERIRNFDKYDGFPAVVNEDNAAILTQDGDIWIGCKEGVLIFTPDKLESQRKKYETFIVGCQISNIDIQNFTEKPIITKAIPYVDAIVLKHNQSMFTFEFAALNFSNQNRVSYKYILEGYEKEWHYNGKNRIASYTNVPPGKYTFIVQTIDEANPDLISSRAMTVTILPPWWASPWAYVVYTILIIIILALVVKFSLFMIKVKNDVYIEQKLSELKIKFFTNISHELRTPLTLITGPIQELKEKENLTEKGKQYVDLMERNIMQMVQLVNQILDFRKIQNGKMRLHVSLIDFNELLASFEKEFRVLANENEISFQFQLPEEGIKVWADKEKIGIVVRNILSNAFKFTSSGGSVFVSVGLNDDSSRCIIRIEDDGVGIPQNKLPEIFDRFAQADNARNSYYQGSGIGLALSKEIINLHHGQLYVESTEGNGSTFVIELQMNKEHYRSSDVDFYMGENSEEEITTNEAMENTDSELLEDDITPDSSLPNLLIVEDNKDLCNMLKLQLEDHFNIYTANDGAEGLKKIHLHHPDIVVTDQMMPNMDGLDMLKRIRNDFQISHIPVIILTAKGNDEAKTKAITMGANAYIIKPFSKDYLMARVEQLLNERKHFQERVWKSNHEVAEAESAEDHYEQFLVKKDVQFIEKIHQVIEGNLENSDFNIDTIASTIGLSRSAFFKKLKGLTGFAPVDLVKEIRLNKSIDLIKNSDMTISEIAFAVGFKDSGYFSKCFRKKYNQSPREYMNEWRKVK